jgi:acyl-CoA dehydrogenase
MTTTTATDWLALARELGASLEPGAAERDEHDAFAGDHYPALKERGVISMMIPADLGGGGASHSTVA